LETESVRRIVVEGCRDYLDDGFPEHPVENPEGFYPLRGLEGFSGIPKKARRAYGQVEAAAVGDAST
jgi:hypothetical protein